MTRDGTASREDPKERQVTLAPWVSPGETAFPEVPEKLGRMVALAGGDLQELRATGVVPASRASRESRAPEVHRVRLVPQGLQG